MLAAPLVPEFFRDGARFAFVAAEVLGNDFAEVLRIHRTVADGFADGAFRLVRGGCFVGCWSGGWFAPNGRGAGAVDFICHRC